MTELQSYQKRDIKETGVEGHDDVDGDVYDLNEMPHNSGSSPYKGRQRRRSSIMFDYLQENYMHLPHITEKHIEDLHTFFELIDGDKDGRLSKQELEKLLRCTGLLVSDRALNELLQTVDTTHNGYISYEDFEQFILDNKILEMMPDETTQEMKAAFDMFDKDKDGFIDREELKVVLTQVGDRMSDELADEFLAAADLNGDGKIDFAEFVKHMGY